MLNAGQGEFLRARQFACAPRNQLARLCTGLVLHAPVARVSVGRCGTRYGRASNDTPMPSPVIPVFVPAGGGSLVARDGRTIQGPSALVGLGRPRLRDVIAGLVTGLFSIPEGMAYASIGGFNPVAGLYSGMVSTILGSVFARTVLMVTTLTSALALSSRSVLTAAGLDPADPRNVAALALVVGVVMLVFGLLKFGAIMNFVSNAVMTGFTTGIAVQIIAGVIVDVDGLPTEQPQHHRQVRRRVRPRRVVAAGAVSGRRRDRRGVGGVPLHQAAAARSRR